CRNASAARGYLWTIERSLALRVGSERSRPARLALCGDSRNSMHQFRISLIRNANNITANGNFYLEFTLVARGLINSVCSPRLDTHVGKGRCPGLLDHTVDDAAVLFRSLDFFDLFQNSFDWHPPCARGRVGRI